MTSKTIDAPKEYKEPFVKIIDVLNREVKDHGDQAKSIKKTDTLGSHKFTYNETTTMVDIQTNRKLKSITKKSGNGAGNSITDK